MSFAVDPLEPNSKSLEGEGLPFIDSHACDQVRCAAGAKNLPASRFQLLVED